MNQIEQNKKIVVSYDCCVVGVGRIGSKFIERAQMEDVSTQLNVVSLRRDNTQYEQTILGSRLLILGMKKSDVLEWLSKYGSKLNESQLVLSLAAGLNFETLESSVNNVNLRIGRIMTSVAIANGSGNIVWTANGKYSKFEVAEITDILSKFGKTEYAGTNNDTAIEKETYCACIEGVVDKVLAEFRDHLKFLGISESKAESVTMQALRTIIARSEQGLCLGMTFDSVATPGGYTWEWTQGMRESLRIALEVGAHRVIMKTQKMYEKGPS